MLGKKVFNVFLGQYLFTPGVPSGTLPCLMMYLREVNGINQVLSIIEEVRGVGGVVTEDGLFDGWCDGRVVPTNGVTSTLTNMGQLFCAIPITACADRMSKSIKFSSCLLCSCLKCWLHKNLWIL